MKLIIDFYKELDVLNLILFWGIIIVITLLLTFSIIMVNKNKKLRQIIATKYPKKISEDEELLNEYDEDLAIKKDVYDEEYEKQNYSQIVEEQENKSEANFIHDYNESKSEIETLPNIEIKENISNKYQEINKEETIKKDNSLDNTVKIDDIDHKNTKEEIENNHKNQSFVAEEYIMEYNTNKNNQLDKYNVEIEKKIEPVENINTPKQNVVTPTVSKPYQKNVLREMYSNQTSPIGITQKNIEKKQEINRAIDLNNNLNYQKTEENNYIKENENRYINPIKKDTHLVIDNNRNNYEQKRNYLRDVSQELNKANASSEIKRTSYELKQEEEAIISFKELMEKKDSIQMIDEEEAIISIEELVKHEKEKLYQITPEEEDNKFVTELKKFRNDL